MRLTPVTLPEQLRPHIHAMWVFESEWGLPADDARVVVPNGRPKLVIPWRNGLCAKGGGLIQHHREGDAVIIGLWDAPTIISSAREPTVSIGVEFTSGGLSRFVRAPMEELSGRIEPIGNVLGQKGDALVRQVQGAETIAAAVALVKTFLVECFSLMSMSHQFDLVEAALAMMAASGFRMDVQEIERRLGYSRRHVRNLFQHYVGMAPKRLNSILAFERLYRAFSQHRSAELLRSDALDLFYDQSHFIRHFKEFTGMTPGRFAEMDNEFGRIFYSDGNKSAVDAPAFERG